MPTNDERRELAGKLRTEAFGPGRPDEVPSDAWFAEQDWHGVVSRCVDGFSIFGDDYDDMVDQCERLADFVEPEPERTCTVVSVTSSGPHAEDTVVRLSCGHGEYGGMPRYCPWCGAKVIGE